MWLPATSTVAFVSVCWQQLIGLLTLLSRPRKERKIGKSGHHLYFKKPISNMIRASVVTILALAAGENASSFSPILVQHASSTQLNADSRREALGSMGIALAGLFAGSFGAPEESLAFNNPALETFKGGKKTKGQFIPGKVSIYWS
jgi:hypothetical protein